MSTLDLFYFTGCNFCKLGTWDDTSPSCRSQMAEMLPEMSLDVSCLSCLFHPFICHHRPSLGLILRTGNVVETGQSKFQEESIPCTPLVSHNVTWNWRIKWQLFNLTMGSGKTRSRCGIILQHRIVNLATERVLSASSRGSPCHKTFRCNSHAKHPSIKLRSPGNKTCLAFGCIVAVQTFNFLP